MRTERLHGQSTMTQEKTKLGLALVIAAVLAGCAKADGTSTGNPVVAELKMTNSAQPAQFARHLFERALDVLFPKAFALPPSAMQDSTGTSVTLSSAWISVSEIKFKPTETAESGESDEAALAGPVFADLLSAAPVSLGQVSLLDQAYRRIEMRLDKDGTPPQGAPSGLTGHSVYLAGTIGGTRSFTYVTQDGTQFRITGAGGFTPENASTILFVVRFADIIKKTNLSAVTNGEQISDSNRVTGSCPQIDASATDVATCFRKGLEALASAGVDRDGDHDLTGSDDKIDD